MGKLQNSIRKILALWILLVLLALPLVFCSCGTKSVAFSITNIVDKKTADVGDTVTYSITLTNTSSIDATGVAVADDWPVGLTYVSSKADQGSYDNSTSVWTIGNLNTKASAKLAITATITPRAGVIILDNEVRVSQVSQTDNNLVSEIADASLTVNSADLVLTDTVDNATPNQQGTVTYTVIVTNNGPADATGVVVYDDLPQGVTYVSNSTNQGNYDITTDNWTVGNLADGASATLIITATVNTGTGALKIDNTAALAYADQPASNLNHNDATASITVNGSDLSISNGEDNTSPSVGATVTFTVTVTNNGPLDDTGIIVTDIVPAGLTYSQSVPDQGTYDPNTGVWNVGSMANGATATLTLKVTVNTGTATQKITSTAKITHSDQPDGDIANETSSTEISVASS